MSELYTHLERLQGKPQQILDQGVPFPTATQPSAPRRGAKPSKRVLLAIPLAAVVVGLMTVIAVKRVQPLFRDGPSPVTETTVSALRSEPQNVSQLPTQQEGSSPGANLGVPGMAPDPMQMAAKDEPAVPSMTTNSGGIKEDGTHPMEASKPTSELPLPASAAPAETMDLSGQAGEVREIAHGAQEKTVEPREARHEESDKHVATDVPVAESAGVPLDRSARRTGAVSRKEPSATAVDQAPKEKPLWDQADEALRHVLVIAEEARRMGHWEEAERGYREYLAERNDPGVMNNLGALLLAQGRFAEAEQILVQARHRFSDPDIAANLAAAYWFQGKKEDACRIARSLQREAQMAWRARNLGTLLDQCARRPP